MLPSKFTRTFLLCFFLALFSFFCLISSGYLDSEDGWLYASVARNIYYHHQISAAPNEYPDLNVHMNSEKGKDGVWRAPGSFGYSLSLIPAVFLSDMVHQAYHIPPPQHFPLEQDWSFHLFASFTNAFYGATLSVILLLYANELGFSKKSSVFISILTLTTTSLLVLTKDSFAHMMFITFMMGCFYCIKRFGSTQNFKYLLFASISFIFLAISYNETFTLTVIPLGIYLLNNESPKQRRVTLLLTFLAFIGALGILTYLKSSFLDLILYTVKIHPKILYEGLWGFLFSPGKSIFLYTPTLLILPFFWHKIKRSILPELIAASLLTFCYIYVLGSASIAKLGMLQPIWHGGMNWGTRYISPLIPFWMFIVFHIIRSLKPIQRKWIVLPLFIWATWVQLVGVGTSYLLQYVDLPYNFFINKTEILVYDYASFIPRYTPLYTLSKQFVKIALNMPQTINHGAYDVLFFDGFDVPYKTPNGVLRGFRDQGWISFKRKNDTPLTLDFEIYNIPDSPEYGQPVNITLNINGENIKQFSVNSQQIVPIQINSDVFQFADNNTVSLMAEYAQKPVAPQVIYIKSMKINGTNVNLGTLDYPDMSKLNTKVTSQPYTYTGKVITDPWIYWQMRARINERSLDFWWIKNFYFWDRPKNFIWALALINLGVFSGSSFLVIQFFIREKNSQ